MTRRWRDDRTSFAKDARETHRTVRQIMGSDRGAIDSSMSFFPFGGAISPGGFIAITHEAFDGDVNGRPWAVLLWSIVHRGFRVRVPVLTEAGTTGEVRLALDVDGEMYYTDIVNVPDSILTFANFAWQHQVPPRTGEEVWLYVEARRTSGAGVVMVSYPPGGLAQVPPHGCTDTGIAL